MNFWLHHLFPAPQKTCPCTILDSNNHFIEYFCVLDDFGTILAHFGVRDVTKGEKILKLWIFDFIIGFPTPKNLPIYIFISKQSIYWVIFAFKVILGPFWLILGSVSSLKGSRFWKFEFLTLSLVSLSQNTYTCTFLDRNNHFVEYFLRFSWFWDHFGSFWGSVTSQKG